MNMYRFIGRCPICQKIAAMTKLKKADPRHPVSHWKGVCQSGHLVTLTVEHDAEPHVIDVAELHETEPTQ